jgi:hypothetical protein
LSRSRSFCTTAVMSWGFPCPRASRRIRRRRCAPRCRSGARTP